MFYYKCYKIYTFILYYSVYIFAKVYDILFILIFIFNVNI